MSALDLSYVPVGNVDANMLSCGKCFCNLCCCRCGCFISDAVSAIIFDAVLETMLLLQGMWMQMLLLKILMLFMQRISGGENLVSRF